MGKRLRTPLNVTRTQACKPHQTEPTRLHQVAKGVVDAVVDAAAAAGLHKLVDVEAGAEAACAGRARPGKAVDGSPAAERLAAGYSAGGGGGGGGGLGAHRRPP